MRPSVRALLTALDAAGRDGLTTGDLARLFGNPVSLQRRLSHIGNELRRYRDSGYVLRSPQEEPSGYYRNTPVRRWFITPAGSAYLASGMKEGRIARARAAAAQREKERAARELRQEQLLREAADAFPAGLCRCARDAEIRHLQAEGCTRPAIGAVYGINRERVRQIAAGISVSPWCEPGHDYASTPCQHGIITPSGPERARRHQRRTG